SRSLRRVGGDHARGQSGSHGGMESRPPCRPSSREAKTSASAFSAAAGRSDFHVVEWDKPPMNRTLETLAPLPMVVNPAFLKHCRFPGRETAGAFYPNLSSGTEFSVRAACGNVKKKVAPSPGVLLAQIFPPCCSTIVFAIANPKPAPM